ncbi:Na(+)-translocating NADH-quinone reductase subunit C [Aquimarina hainanensis]|uniref:Na(+)-translocating NADH-quinone reductase subunit C n=1 Tax=Aquimarina hainanensis TaxID=1578017 RepID=A0ABW5NAV7_9FLAO|nr:Na(+)-translocating NADH-quinone reductase subunit C [Aquimarina sp. TRL1]QKX05547.1 Na(+)-translocating NADH-quinone reductase subunit C [Aquimarina sp. TRL1]
MAMNTDKNSYTIIFSILMVIVVGSLLAGVSSGLKGNIDANKKKEKQQNILFAMGVTDSENPNDFVPAEQAQELFEKYIGEEQYIIVDGKAEKTSEAFAVELKKENDAVKQDANYKRRLPLFIGEKDGEKFYILPVRGNGLWDAIWGYIALDKDFTTIKGAFFDHKGETPGLGANIKESFFRDDFKGEKIYNASGSYQGVTVKKGNGDPKNDRKDDNAVDAIAGATITGNGVTVMVKKGIKMYLPYFESLKK